MVSKVGGSSGASAKIFMPTKDQLKTVYGNIAEKALSSGKAKALKHAPRGIEKYQSVDITPKGEMGVSKQVYMYKGELYLKTEVVAPNAKPQWFNIGPAPMF